MNGTSMTDLALLLPEIILVGMALALILAARRVQNSLLVAGGTVLAAVSAALVAIWIAPETPTTGFGSMIILDGYSQFFKVLIAAALALVALLSVRRISADDVRPAEYHALLLLASTGMMFAASANDLLTLYLALELTTLSSYILVGITVERPRSNEAAIKYFLLGAFASALLLYGIALVYGITGHTEFANVATYLSTRDVGSDPILLAAIGLLTAGLAFKVAAVPFHVWVPDAYQGASSPVAAFLAAGSKAAGIAALGRICLSAFAAEADLFSVTLAGLAALSIVTGSIAAVSQTDMKRLLAYSSIAHVGYALLGFVAATSGTPDEGTGNVDYALLGFDSVVADGVMATLTYTFLYVFMTLGAFGVVVALGRRGESLEGYRGLAVQRPGLAALMLLFLLSLTGIPPTAGFVAKFVVILSVVHTGHLALALLAVACSVISAFVYLRVGVLMYMQEPKESEPARSPWTVSVALAVAALVTIVGGILPGSLTFWAAAS